MRKILKQLFRHCPLYSGVSTAIVLLFCFGATSGQKPSAVLVSPETTIESDRFTLGNVSDVSGDPDRFARLKAISLGYAPNIGMTREISRGQILLAIRASGFSEKEVSLNSPERILIRRAGQEISQHRIREAVEKAVMSQFPAGEIAASIVRLDVPDNIQVPAGTLEIRVNAASVRNLFARFPLPVEIRVESKTVRSFSATVEVEAFADVLVAANDLAANAKVVETDVRIEKRRLERPLMNYIRDTKQLRGGVLLRSIRSGTVITTDSFTAGIVVRSGDSVSVEARSGNLKIIIKGEARASGKIGDRIAVKNSNSGAILQAVVLDEGLVKVTF